jgi:DNA invertase Pin-like site-specific DNA recombinase
MEEFGGIYTRVSDVHGREGDSFGSTEIQEAVCRARADRDGVIIPADAVVNEEDVSGTLAAEDRQLDSLIRRVESGELRTIYVKNLDRFARDTIAGAVAEKRIIDSGGRLIAVEDSYDSSAPGSRTIRNIRYAMAEDFIERTKSNYKASRRRASARGVYLAARAPFGYDRMDEVDPQYGSRGQLLKDGRLVVNERKAELRREAAERRAAGANIGQITRWLQSEGIDITKSGVRSMLKSRAALGEAKDADGNVVKNAHAPIMDEALWERSNAVKGEYHPRDGSIAEKLTLSGLVVCDGCGKRCRGGAYGRNGKRTPQYVCTTAKCARRAGMKAEKLHEIVQATVQEALLNRKDPATGEPVNPNSVYVGAILEGDTRYVEAEQAVADARRNLEEYRDSLEIQETLGLEAFAEGLRVRKEAYALAQKALRETPRPTFGSPDEILTEASGTRAFYQRFVSEIRLRPASEGDDRRVEVRFHGQPAARLEAAA